MAKYEGVHSCGHEGVIEVFGPSKDQQQRINQIKEKYKAIVGGEAYV